MSSTGAAACVVDLYLKQCDCTVWCIREELLVQGQRLRRARLYDRDSQAWVIIRPGQTWEDGEVCGPHQSLLPCICLLSAHFS